MVEDGIEVAWRWCSVGTTAAQVRQACSMPAQRPTWKPRQSHPEVPTPLTAGGRQSRGTQTRAGPPGRGRGTTCACGTGVGSHQCSRDTA